MTIETRNQASYVAIITVICQSCRGLVDSEDDGSVLGVWENSKVNMSWAKGVADFHQERCPDHSIFINSYSMDN